MTSLGKDIKELVDLGYDLTTAAEMAQNDRKGFQGWIRLIFRFLFDVFLRVFGVSPVSQPGDRKWKLPDKPRRLGGESGCPTEKLVDVQKSVDDAVKIVEELKNKVEKVPPIVISRLFRGGKTTLIDLIAHKLSQYREYYVIAVTTNRGFHRRTDESWLAALIRLIAYQLIERNPVLDRITMFTCNEIDLLICLDEINKQGKTVVLLVDELSKCGVPLDAETSSFLSEQFLDKKGRYLIFSSHVQLYVNDAPVAPQSASASFVMTSSSSRTIRTIHLPFCADRSRLQNMLNQDSVTDLEITLAAGIPSLLYVMKRPSSEEITFEQRLNDNMKYYLESKNQTYNEFLNKERNKLLNDFLSRILYGEMKSTFFEAFSTPHPSNSNLMLFPLPYIPLILQYLRENAGMNIYNSLASSASTVETGRDWELVVTFSIYIRCLAAKYCSEDEHLRAGPFNIATNGVQGVEVFTLPVDITTVSKAVAYINEVMDKPNTIYIFQMAYAKFPHFDGMVSYRSSNLSSMQEVEEPIIHGYQCKLTRGYPRCPVDAALAKGWFLRGGRTVQTPTHDGWVFPTVEEIENKLLGVGLRILHPMSWGSFPVNDGFD